MPPKENTGGLESHGRGAPRRGASVLGLKSPLRVTAAGGWLGLFGMCLSTPQSCPFCQCNSHLQRILLREGGESFSQGFGLGFFT
mmetsp:Transcript_86374/g.143694  ORF Transcript_86374/g.143694 Transcript_86374/m.143694 type:complete len:85 (+) Transcript_86374:1050-1304(+)